MSEVYGDSGAGDEVLHLNTMIHSILKVSCYCQLLRSKWCKVTQQPTTCSVGNRRKGNEGEEASQGQEPAAAPSHYV